MLKILVVEDFKSIRNVICNTLNGYGFETLEAENGKIATSVLDQNPGKIDLIISDYNMPEMNGYELLKATKESPMHKNIPMILITSEKDLNKMKEAKALGLGAWIQKPYKIENLIDQINYCIDKSKK